MFSVKSKHCSNLYVQSISFELTNLLKKKYGNCLIQLKIQKNNMNIIGNVENNFVTNFGSSYRSYTLGLLALKIDI